jgi:phage tail-like protein
MDEQVEPIEGTGHSRRAFLGRTAGLTGVALAAGAWGIPSALAAPASAATAVTQVESIDLTLDGSAVGSLLSIEGGHATSDVIADEQGAITPADNVVHKHIAGVKYEDITMRAGTGMSKSFYNWVKDTLDGNGPRQSGELSIGTANSRSSLQFENALCAEVGFPALDAASKDAAKMTIKISPEYTRYSRTKGLPARLPLRQKTWLPSNFRLSIDGLDTARVGKIEAIVIKQSIAPGAKGGLEPTGVEFPNLVVGLPEANSDTWESWLEDFVIKGNNGPQGERNGKLVYLAADGTSLFSLDLVSLGIFRLAPAEVDAGQTAVRQMTAELYCDQMTFTDLRT